MTEGLEEFSSWLAPHGLPPSKLSFGFFTDTERGIEAKEDIQEGEILVSIPKSILINSQTIDQHPALGGSVFADMKKVWDPVHVLCAFLLFEKHVNGTSSPWHPYIQALPKSFTSLVYYSEEELQMLQSPLLIEKARQHQLKVQAHYHSFMKGIENFRSVFGDHRPTLDEFLWARCVVMTRACYMPIDDKRKDSYTLVPFGDFFNYDFLETEAGFDESTQSYVFKAGRDFKKGQEVFICYGKHSNFKLLKHYGFIPKNSKNPHDKIKITFAQILQTHERVLSKYEERRQKKLLAGEKKGGKLTQKEKSEIMKNEETKRKEEREIMFKRMEIIDTNCLKDNLYFAQDEVSWNIYVCLRVLFIAPDSLKSHYFKVLQGNELSSSTREKLVKHAISAMALEMRESFAASTVEEDAFLLQTAQQNYQQTMAITVRKGHKEVLESVIRLCDA